MSAAKAGMRFALSVEGGDGSVADWTMEAVTDASQRTEYALFDENEQQLILGGLVDSGLIPVMWVTDVSPFDIEIESESL